MRFFFNRARIKVISVSNIKFEKEISSYNENHNLLSVSRHFLNIMK